MPKEIIHSRYPDPEDGPRESLVHVGWTREHEHVEVATIVPDERKLDTTPEGNGWFVQLDRSGINRLIRALRQARDQAFGRDE